MENVVYETLLAIDAKAPKRKKILKKLLKPLKHITDWSLPITNTPVKELAQFVKLVDLSIAHGIIKDPQERLFSQLSAGAELAVRDPGLYQSLYGLDTKHVRNRQTKLFALFKHVESENGETFLQSIRRQVSDITERQAKDALSNAGCSLNLFEGATVDISGTMDDATSATIREFVNFISTRSIIEAKKLQLMERVYDPLDLKGCIYAGILSQFVKAADLVPWGIKDKDDLYGEIVEYLWKEKAEEIATSPAIASIETRLRRLAERHTRIYITSLLREREKATAMLRKMG
jgi:hypothetical protein